MVLTLELYDESSYSWNDKTDKCIRLRHSISSRELESIGFELIGEDVNVGQKIRVKRDNNIIFEGIVYERSRKQRGGLLSVKATAYSYLILYDRQIIYRIYQTGLKAGEIIRDLGKLIDDEFPVNLNEVEDGDSLLSPWKIENRSALEIVKSVARGTNYWLRMKPCLSYLVLDGQSGNYILVNLPRFPSSFTIAILIRKDAQPPDYGFEWIFRYTGSGARWFGWVSATIEPNNPSSTYFRIADTSNNNNEIHLSSGPKLGVGEWLWIIYWYDGSTMRIYKNNELCAEKSETPQVYTSSASLQIGRHGSGGYHIPLSYGQFLIYEKPLNENEIERLVADPINPPLEELFLYLNFTKFENNTIPDLSGNGNDGTAYGDVSQGYEVYPQYVNSMLLEFKSKVMT